MKSYAEGRETRPQGRFDVFRAKIADAPNPNLSEIFPTTNVLL